MGWVGGVGVARGVMDLVGLEAFGLVLGLAPLWLLLLRRPLALPPLLGLLSNARSLGHSWYCAGYVSARSTRGARVEDQPGFPCGIT